MKSLAVIRPAGSQMLTLPRPSYVVRSCTSADDSSGDEEIFEQRPMRKRQRLDHLTPEEKLQRRKLKNRVAAQTARDRKKARMDELEASVAVLEKEVEKLKTENDLLWKLNSNLKTENETLKAALEKKNVKVAVCSELSAEVKSEMPVDPAEGTGLSLPATCGQLASEERQSVPSPPVLGDAVDLDEPGSDAVDCDRQQGWDQILAELASFFADEVGSQPTGEACKGDLESPCETQTTAAAPLEESVILKTDHVYAQAPVVPIKVLERKPSTTVMKPRPAPVIRIQLPEGCTTLDLRVPGAWEDLLRASLSAQASEDVSEFVADLPSSPTSSGYASTPSPQAEDSGILPDGLDLSDEDLTADILMNEAEFERDSFPWSDDLKLSVWP